MDDYEERTSAVGYLNYGKSYLDSAYYLVEGTEKEALRLNFDAPIFHLIGQANELFFKAILRTGGHTIDDFNEWGHNLETLATKSQSVEGFDKLVRRVDLGLKAFWRTRLKEERDAYQKSIPSEFVQVVDMPSNNEIDKNLPSYGELLKLLNSMYGKSPYHTRYFLRGAKTIPNVWLLLTVTSIIYDLALPQCLDYSRNTEL